MLVADVLGAGAAFGHCERGVGEWWRQKGKLRMRSEKSFSYRRATVCAVRS